MPGTRILPFLACFAIAISSMADADTITYEFSGNLSAPINGSTQFSGTVTTDISKPPVDGNGWAVQNFNPNEVTLNFANHSASIASNGGGQDNSQSISLSYLHNSTNGGNVGDTFELLVDARSAVPGSGLDPEFYGSGLRLSLRLTNPAGNVFPSTALLTLPVIHLGDFPENSVNITLETSPSTTVSGTLTSFEPLGDPVPTPVPEPGTLAIFALIGVIGLVRTRRAS